MPLAAGAPDDSDATTLPLSRRPWDIAMLLLLVAYVAGLALHGPAFEPLVDGWLGVLTQVVPAAACWVAARDAGPRRREVTLLALAVTAFAVGNVLFVLAASSSTEPSFPSSADIGYLCFYPAVLAAVVLAVRLEIKGVSAAVWWNSLLGAGGAAAVLAVLLQGVFEQAMGGPLQVTVALAYPVFDLMLVAAIVGVAAIQGARLQRHWLPLLVGLALFAAADVVYALRVAAGSYRVGTPLDALWAVGLTVMTLWARGSFRRPAQQRAAASGALVVPATATAASLGVLVAGNRTHISNLAIILATVTLLVAAGRTQLAFRQVRRIADLRRQATTDDLTGLPNRRAFYSHVTGALAAACSSQAMLLLDLDGFKEVNDSLGHHVGDELLSQVGKRLAGRLREGDLLARLGGDEFAVLLDDTEAGQAVAAAGKLREALTEPFILGGIAVHTDVSIGISLAPQHGTDLTVLLRRADIAMYKAKRSHAGHRLYASADDADGDERLRTLEELRAAFSGNELILHYQPKLDLRTDQVCGVEALVRWDHPTRGLLYPVSFLELVHDSGLMRQMTRYVLERALDQAAEWVAQGRPLTVAVNLSASSLVDADLPEQVTEMLAARQLPAAALQLEITEEFLMADRERARHILRQLRELGVEISVDDFGTGYSSLAYLRELPIDELKLDRSFVFPMADDARAAALVVSTISLAHSLGLRMVAEGVENATALAELTRHGCDQAQGYHLSRPVPAAELDHWLDTRSTSHALGAARR